jgi:hypothetical protein
MMNKQFLNNVKMSKNSIDWWREQSIECAFAAEELNFRYETGELTEEELFKKTKELDNRILYLMAKGGFENRNLFEIFTGYINEKN